MGPNQLTVNYFWDCTQPKNLFINGCSIIKENSVETNNFDSIYTFISFFYLENLNQ